MKKLLLFIACSYVLSASVTVVQKKECHTSGSVASLGCTFASTPTAGNMIVVGISAVNGGLNFAVTDNKSNSYTILAAWGGCATQCVQLDAGIATTSSATFTVTATYGTGSGFVTLMIAEYSGMPASVMLDGSVGNNSTATNPNCGSVPVANSQDLIITAISYRQSGTATLAANSPFTTEVTQLQGLNNGMPGGMADYLSSARGEVAAGWTGGSNNTFACVVVGLVVTQDTYTYPKVQQASCNGSTGGGTVKTCTFYSQPVVGNYVLVVAMSINPTSATVTDNQSNSYSAIKQQTGSSILVSLQCSHITTSSGTFTVTSTYNGSGPMNLVIFEVTGLSSCTADVTSGNTVGAGGSSPYTCGSLTTTNANDVIIVGLASGQNGVNSIGFTAGTGFSLEVADSNGAVNYPFAVQDKMATSTGAQSPQFTGSGISSYGCAAAAFPYLSGSVKHKVLSTD